MEFPMGTIWKKVKSVVELFWVSIMLVVVASRIPMQMILQQACGNQAASKWQATCGINNLVMEWQVCDNGTVSKW